MVATFKKLLQRAERGEIVGGMHVIAVSDGPEESGICGEFADYPDYAEEAARVGLSCLLKHAASSAAAIDPFKEAK